MASNREDLLDNLNRLNVGYRLCSLHFDDKMFSNDLRNRLHLNAVPTIFPLLEGSSSGTVGDHTYTPFYVLPRNVTKRTSSMAELPSHNDPPTKIKIMQNICLKQGT